MTAAGSTWSSTPNRSSASPVSIRSGSPRWPCRAGSASTSGRDRRLIAEIERRTGAVPLLVDFDAEVLEAGHANVWIAEDGTLVTPPLDGRLLPGTIRARLLSRPPEGLEVREEPLSLGRLARADELLLTSSVRGVHPAVLAGSRSRFEIGARLRAALLEEELEVAAP